MLQFPRLAPLLAALAGLGLYDVAGTIFAAGAAEDAMLAQAAPTVMEGVAQAKLSAAAGGGQAWQPGLYTVLLQGRLTDALGLGDVVAPAMLAGWARRFDLRPAAARGAAAGGRGGPAPSPTGVAQLLQRIGEEPEAAVARQQAGEEGQQMGAGGGGGGGGASYLSAVLHRYSLTLCLCLCLSPCLCLSLSRTLSLSLRRTLSLPLTYPLTLARCSAATRRAASSLRSPRPPAPPHPTSNPHLTLAKPQP